MHRTFRSLAASAAILSATPALAQEWFLETPDQAPAARRFHGMGALGADVILFGGVDERQGQVLGDTWRFDGRHWTPVATMSPAPRQRFASCVDPSRGTFLVFGGADQLGQPLDDLWAFDGAQWHLVDGGTGPLARIGAAMAFDRARDAIVLFGGHPGDAGAPLDDTWEFGGTGWTPRVFLNAPPARHGHAMTFDPARAVTILFGGFPAGATGFDGDTWELDGAGWRRIATPAVPAPAVFPALTFFEAHGIAVLTASSGAPGQRVQTWIYDGVDWQPGPPAPSGLLGRQGHAVAYDAVRQAVTLFGGASIGFGGALPRDDTWQLAERADAAAFGSGCAFGQGTPVLSPRAGDRPELGTAFGLEAAPAGGFALLLFGTNDQSFGGQPLPLDLAAHGLPGCALLVAPQLVTSMPVAGGTGRAEVALPADGTLLGATFVAQALLFDATAAPFAATSNGLRAVLGN